MRYKDLEVVPFWTMSEKRFAIKELNRLLAENESLKAELECEKTYSKNAITCNERLQLKNLDLVKSFETAQKTIINLKYILENSKKGFFKKLFK